VNAECYQRTTNCIQWVKTLMSIPRRWCNRQRFGLTLTVIFLCKIRAPRLLVTVRVFCLFHTASKCTKTSQIHVQHYNNWKSCSTQQGRQCCLRQAYYLTNFTLVWPWPLTYWPQSWSFHAVACWPLVPIYIKSVQSFSKYRLDKFVNRRMDGQTIKQVKNTLPLSVSLAWWSHYESW